MNFKTLSTAVVASSQVKGLLDLRIAIIRILNAMANRPRILIDLVVVATLERLVAEEVDCLVVHSTRHVLVVLDVLKAVRLVPACWEDVEGDLAADRVTATQLVEG
jgi:hypothetical protein